MVRNPGDWSVSRIGVGLFLLLTLPAVAMGQGSDNAGNAPYADGWQTGDNGGTGFGPWFVDTATGLDTYTIDTAPADAANNLGAPAFRVDTAGGFGSFYASRPFAVPMVAGQSFQLDFDPHSIDDLNEDFESTGHGDIGIFFESEFGERLALYSYYAYDFGSDFWGINADSAFDNLNGGAHLPEDDLGGIEWRSTATVSDSEDGMTLILDLPTIDTYRLRIVDDNVTKLDVSGTLNSTVGDPPISVVGQPIELVAFYGSDNDLSGSFTNVSYFNNLQLSAPPSGSDGDYNEDGFVNAADYAAWRKLPSTFGGDPAGYNAWRQQFGETGAGAGGGPVPEPASLIIVLLGVASFAFTRPGRRR
jgi:hypothetical protein